MATANIGTIRGRAWLLAASGGSREPQLFPSGKLKLMELPKGRLDFSGVFGHMRGSLGRKRAFLPRS
jgi:hypothetical protein